MVRWKLKGCPRCSGDLNIIRDVLGIYEDCLQCGYHHYYKESYVNLFQKQQDEKEKGECISADPVETSEIEDRQ